MRVSTHRSGCAALVAANLLVGLPSGAGGRALDFLQNPEAVSRKNPQILLAADLVSPQYDNRINSTLQRQKLDESSKKSPGLRPGFQDHGTTLPLPRKSSQTKNSRQEIPPRVASRSRYSRSLRKSIHRHNKKGQLYGDIQLYARENRWGPAVKIQRCYGDNILTSFSVINKGATGKLGFEFKNTTFRNRGRHRHRWILVKPGMIIRGRHIFLRAQSSKGSGVITIKVRGNCIEESPPASPSEPSSNG